MPGPDSQRVLITRKDNPGIHSLVADVGNEDDVKALATAAQTELGGSDILVKIVAVGRQGSRQT
ncbi:MAG: hypothetical protein GY732_19080 [Gammaproteobacteria bacterium]|nr:hypothetical protein [Gammaproteobacteria bacterium]